MGFRRKGANLPIQLKVANIASTTPVCYLHRFSHLWRIGCHGKFTRTSVSS
jgi:hypothetical protein